MITLYPNNIPNHASRYEYTAGRHTGVYYVWRQGTSFYWEAMGNNGEEKTLVLAEQAARAWIRDRILA